MDGLWLYLHLLFKSRFNFDLASAHLLLSLWTREMKVPNNETAPARAVIFQFISQLSHTGQCSGHVYYSLQKASQDWPTNAIVLFLLQQVQESSLPIQHNRRQHKEP